MTTAQLAEATAQGLRQVGEELLEAAGRIETILHQAGDADPKEVDEPTATGVGAGWTWHLVEERSDQTFLWPNDEAPERYVTFRVFEGMGSEGTVRMGLGECERDIAAGRGWHYYMVFIVRERGIEPVVEFREADAAGPEGPFVAVIRGKGKTKREMYAPGDELPAGYENLPLGVHREHVAAGYRRLAVVARPDQPEIMLDHGLLQARGRYGYRPS